MRRWPFQGRRKQQRAIGPDELKARQLRVQAREMEGRATRIRQSGDREAAQQLFDNAAELKRQAREILDAAQQRENETAGLTGRPAVTLGK